MRIQQQHQRNGKRQNEKHNWICGLICCMIGMSLFFGVNSFLSNIKNQADEGKSMIFAKSSTILHKVIWRQQQQQQQTNDEFHPDCTSFSV